MSGPGSLLRWPAIGVVMLAMPTVSWGQRATVGPSFTLMVAGGDGVETRGCGETHFGAPGVQVATPIAGNRVTLHLAGRGFVLGLPTSCAAAPSPPPPDGTYIVADRVSLLSRRFLTTDARLGLTAPGNAAMLTAGAGIAWREGHNVPYFVAAVGIPFVDGVTRRFGLQVDYHWVRLTSDRFQRTFLNGQMTAEQSLGTAHAWSHALTVGLRLGIAL
jgi:hypothetical protein